MYLILFTLLIIDDMLSHNYLLFNFKLTKMKNLKALTIGGATLDTYRV